METNAVHPTEAEVIMVAGKRTLHTDGEIDRTAQVPFRGTNPSITWRKFLTVCVTKFSAQFEFFISKS
jgi:hypothetical protein